MGNKIQRIYIGENIVYPIQKYSYDFRGKTTSQATSDGWSLGSGTSINANGIKSSQFSANIHNLPFSVANSERIIMTWGLYNANNGNKSLGLVGNSSSSTLMYLGRNTDGRWTAQINGTEVSWLTGKSSPSGQSVATFTLDFKSLQWSFVYNGTTMSGTFTQIAADNMRNNLYGIRFFVQYSDAAIQYVKLVSYG